MPGQNSQLFDRPEEIIVSIDRFAVESSRRIINIAEEQGVSPEICLCRSTRDAFVDDLSGGAHWEDTPAPLEQLEVSLGEG